MNAKINQLIKQSYVTIQTPSGDESAYFSQEKFAELIVRECMEIVEAQKESLCDDENAWSDRDYGYEQAVNDSVDMIKQHFGVEE
jgi:hypothetical protein